MILPKTVLSTRQESQVWKRLDNFGYLAIVATLSVDLLFPLFGLLQGRGAPTLNSALVFLNGLALWGLIRRFISMVRRPRRNQLRPSLFQLAPVDDYQTRLLRAQALADWGDWEFDITTQQAWWSPALLNILGHDPDQSTPTFEAVFQQIPTDERDLVRARVRQSLWHGQPLSIDYSIVRPDGDTRHVTCQGEAIRSQTGEVIRYAGVVQDITAARQKALVEQTSKARFQPILDTANAAIFDLRVYRDRTLIVDYASAGVEAVYGYTSAEFLAASSLWLDSLYSRDRQQLLPSLFQTIWAEQQAQFEFRIQPKVGDLRWLTSAVTSCRDESQDCWRVTAVTIDISHRQPLETERQQAEIAVRQRQLLWRQVLDSLPHQVFAKDVSGRFLLANQAAAATHGVTPEQLIGHHETDFNAHLDNDWLAQVAALNQAVIDTQQPQTLPDMQLTGPTGDIGWCQVHLIPYRGPDGHICGTISHALDITERKQLQLALQESQARLTATLDSTKAAIVNCRMYPDRHWEYLYISPGCEAVLGYSAEELMADKALWISQVLPEDWNTIIVPAFDDVFNEKPVILEYRLRQKDGTQRWISSAISSRHDRETNTWLVSLVESNITQRKTAELALRASQAQYQMLVNSINGVVWEADPETFQFTFVSPQAEALLGYPLTDWLMPHFWVDHVCPEDVDAAIAHCQKGIREKKDHQFEYRMLTADGRVVWIEDIVKLVFKGPRLVKLVGLLLDISDRKQAENALGKSQQLLQRIVDSVPQAIFWKDCRSVYLGCNQNFADYAGLISPAAVVGKTDHDLPWLPEEAALYRRIDHEVIASGQPQLHRIEQQHTAAGAVIWVETSKVSLTDAAGKVVGILGTYEDITQRQVTKQALQESEARFRAVFEQSTVGIALINPEGRFLRVNATYAAITGYSPEELMTMNCCSLTYPEDQLAGQQAMASLIAGEQSACCIEKRYLCKGGEQKWVNLILCPVIERNSTTFNFLTAVVIDITDRKQIEQALKQRTAQEQMFNRVVQTIRSSLELETVFATTVREASYFLEICRVSIAQYLPERQCWQHVMEHRCQPDMPSKLGFEIPDQDNPFAEQLKRWDVVRVDSTADIEDPINRALAAQFPGSWLLVPVVVNGQIWGSLNLFKDQSIDQPCSEQQVELVQRLADQLAIAIQQSTLYEQLKAANQQLQYLAMHDSLTQLDNRRSFEAYLGREWGRLVRSQEDIWISLVLCDIDYFKQYNDLYGHVQGDACLTQVAQTLALTVQRPTDMIARYGGEEFAVILPATDEAGAIHVVQQIQRAIANLELPHAGSQVAPQITFSFGVACICKRPPSDEVEVSSPTLATFVEMADQALYQAKVLGRDRYQVISAVF